MQKPFVHKHLLIYLVTVFVDKGEHEIVVPVVLLVDQQNILVCSDHNRFKYENVRHENFNGLVLLRNFLSSSTVYVHGIVKEV